MSDSNIGQEILDGIKEIKKFKDGSGKLKTHVLSEPSPPKLVRERLKLSRSAFAGFMGVSTRTVREWEQGRKQPKGPAKALLRIAERHPEVFIERR